MGRPIAKSLDEPDRSQPFPDGSVRTRIDLPTVSIGRGVYQPGWRWSAHARPPSGADSAAHVGYVVSGRMIVRGADGVEVEVGPGEGFEVPAGHDAWVVGDEPCVALDFASGRPSRGWKLYQALRLALRWLRWWVRLEGRGLDALPRRGPVLVVSNHDSWLDPLAIAEVMMWRERPARFLARASLWKWPIVAPILDRIAQIPIRRGTGDTRALDAAVAALGRGEAIGIFPEGTFSRGQSLRARRGVARLAQACPDVPLVLAAVSGGTELKRFPRRPRIIVEFFPPARGQAHAAESPTELAQRLLDEIRVRVPPTK